ncbi:MAG: glycosyltransferase family 39 protein [Deltaproteobacteria bacterium]|nr:MAG: glycosyltransferase family 39 protein [Deltaproteobacteria bacterium]
MTEPRARLDPALPGILLLAFALRAALCILYPDLEGRGDEPLHYVLGVLTAHLGADAIARWAPGYEALLAAVFRLFGPDPNAARIVQVVLGTATVGGVYGLARRAGGMRAGRLAGLLAATYPSLVAYVQYLYSETLFMFLLVAAVYTLHRSDGGPTRSEQVAAGVLLGLAALTRAVVVYFLPLWLVVALARRRPQEARAAALVLAVALAVIAPWSVRNAFHHGGFLLVDPTLGRTAYLAFNDVRFNRDLGLSERPGPLPERARCPAPRVAGRAPLPPVAELRALFPPVAERFTRIAGGTGALIALARDEAATDFAAVQRCEVRRALDFAVRKPGTVMQRSLERVYAFWGPNSFLLRSVHQGVYRGGPLARANFAGIEVVTVLAYLLVMGAAILAFGRRELPRLFTWCLLFGAYYTGMHVLAVAYSRYRLPLLPLAIAVGAVWLADPRGARHRGRHAAALVALILFLALSVHYVTTVLPR